MTRFDAVAPADRQKLYAEAIQAHRERGRGFVTFEVDEESIPDRDDEELEPPWMQFADGMVNLDCTDEELETLKGLLSEYPVFKIDELHRPDDAEGVNVRISAKADPNRIGQFVESAFRRTYDLPETFRVWVVDL
jgi:hypothetical protein